MDVKKENAQKAAAMLRRHKAGERNMSSVEKITELAKDNFETDSFIVNLSYLGTQA